MSFAQFLDILKNMYTDKSITVITSCDTVFKSNYKMYFILLHAYHYLLYTNKPLVYVKL